MRPSVKQRDREERFPAEEIKKLAELGCCGMMIPEEWGGPGLDTLSYVLMLEEVARVDAAMATSLSVTNSAVQVPLVKFGTEEQKKKYLRRLATGEILGSFCLTEPAAGSDAAGIQSRAVAVQRVGSGLGARTSPVPAFAPAADAAWSGAPLGTPGGDVYRLNGTKTWVSNGHVAGLFIVFAKTDPDAGGKGITAFLVEPSFPGFKVGRHEDKMGQRSTPAVEILLNDCEVPRENRLGEEGQGLKIALSALGWRADWDCGAGSRFGAGRARRIGEACQGAAGVWQVDRRVSGDSVDAGGHADGDRGGARAGLSCGVA